MLPVMLFRSVVVVVVVVRNVTATSRRLLNHIYVFLMFL